MPTGLDTGNYFGKLVSKRQLPKIILSETRYVPHCRLPKHHHNNFYLCCVLKGHYAEQYGKTIITCNAGDIIVHPVDLEHSNSFGENGGTCFNIEYTGSQVMEEMKHLPHKKLNAKFFAIRGLVDKIHTEYKQFDAFSPMIIEGLVLEIAGYSARFKPGLPAYWFQKVNAILNDHPLPCITLSFIAEELNISSSHLAREFKKSAGTSIGQYIIDYKVRQAREKLLQKNADILGVALELGFADQSHFTRTFRKLCGTTPKKYITSNS
jgi:AraC family transcriptional regulator